MQRRTFLSASSLAAVPLAFDQLPLARLLAGADRAAEDRVLVLIALNGGNDGLNTVVPLDQYDNLQHARPNVVLPRESLLGVTPTVGFHPAFAALRETYDEGLVTVVQSVGYPEQNRSHFRSTDIWNTGSASAEYESTGWLGRHLDAWVPGYPKGFPNARQPDPFAITVGASVSETCEGVASNFAYTLKNPFDATSILETVSGGGDDRPRTGELAFLRTSISQANAYGGVVKERAEAGNTIVDYPDDNQLAQRLRYVAQMISGGLGTRVYVLNLGGFDTHAEQVDPTDRTAGAHAHLLQTVSDAVAAFQKDLAALGIAERVVGMTYSEFGRQIMSNGAAGTDHGTAAPMFVFGAGVNPGVLGDNPTIERETEVREGVPMQYDFRDVYGTVLEDWFGVGEADVRSLLHDDYVRLPLFRRQASPTLERGPEARVTLSVLDNPFAESTQLAFALPGTGRYVLEAYDVTGKRLETLFSRRLAAGEHRVRVDAAAYPAGVVVFRLSGGADVRTVRAFRR